MGAISRVRSFAGGAYKDLPSPEAKQSKATQTPLPPSTGPDVVNNDEVLGGILVYDTPAKTTLAWVLK